MVSAVVGLVALVVTLAGLAAGAGHAGYLGMLMSAANKRAGGQPAIDFARKRMPGAGVSAGVGLIAVLIALSAGVGGDIFAILLGGGAGAFSAKQLQSTQQRFRSGQY